MRKIVIHNAIFEITDDLRLVVTDAKDGATRTWRITTSPKNEANGIYGYCFKGNKKTILTKEKCLENNAKEFGEIVEEFKARLLCLEAGFDIDYQYNQ